MSKSKVEEKNKAREQIQKDVMEFLEKGGKSFSYIDCLNDTPVAIKMYQQIINRELLGWLK